LKVRVLLGEGWVMLRCSASSYRTHSAVVGVGVGSLRMTGSSTEDRLRQPADQDRQAGPPPLDVAIELGFHSLVEVLLGGVIDLASCKVEGLVKFGRRISRLL
jgi:hypothetical protein